LAKSQKQIKTLIPDLFRLISVLHRELSLLKTVLDSFAFVTGKLNPRSAVSAAIVDSHLRKRRHDKTTVIAQLSLLVSRFWRCER
jgi:hypothetical protein